MMPWVVPEGLPALGSCRLRDPASAPPGIFLHPWSPWPPSPTVPCIHPTRSLAPNTVGLLFRGPAHRASGVHPPRFMATEQGLQRQVLNTSQTPGGWMCQELASLHPQPSFSGPVLPSHSAFLYPGWVLPLLTLHLWVLGPWAPLFLCPPNSISAVGSWGLQDHSTPNLML